MSRLSLGIAPAVLGSTGNLPVPLGNLPSGTESARISEERREPQTVPASRSTGLVAQRHGQVARATRERDEAPSHVNRRTRPMVSPLR